MNRAPRCVQAFTLIELMIAVALGSLIIYTAMAGFRTASQTVTTANRLSLENSLLRAGYFEAQIQLDFWTNLDDPTDPTRQELRQTGKNDRLYNDPVQGLPFTPMQAIWKQTTGRSLTASRADGTGDGHNDLKVRGTSTLPATATAVDTWDGDTGWDPGYAWAPHDPRTWCRVNLAEKNRPCYNDNVAGWIPFHVRHTIPDYPFGRYAIFSLADDTLPSSLTLNPQQVQLDFNAAKDITPLPPAVELKYAGFPTSGMHTWQGRQVRSLLDCLGYAALTEYLPANAIYAFYKTGDHANRGGLANIGSQPKADWNEYWFDNGDGYQMTSRGIYRQTYSTSYGYFNPRSPANFGASIRNNTTVADKNHLLEWHYRFFTTDYGAYEKDSNPANWNGSDDMRWFVEHTAFPESMLPTRPDYWPQIDVTVGRWVKNARHIALAKVQRISPLTGEIIELSWTGLGTSLRGARMQRGQTSGWATWDNKRGSSTNSPHLDSP